MDIGLGKKYRNFGKFKSLKRIIRVAYEHVRREDDIAYEGYYSPDARDEAERARGELLGLLVDTPSEHVYDELKEMSQEPMFRIISERLLGLADRRANQDSDHKPWTPPQVAQFAESEEKEPKTIADLHELVRDRLWDIEDSVVDVRFIDKRTLRHDLDERPIQLMIADQLYTRSILMYSIEREAELPTRDEPDIQIQRAGINVILPIEKK